VGHGRIDAGRRGQVARPRGGAPSRTACGLVATGDTVEGPRATRPARSDRWPYALDFDRPLRGDCTLQLGPWPGFEVELALVDDKRQVLCSVGPIAEDVGEVAFPELRTVEVAAVDESDAPVEGVEVALRPNDWRPDYGDCNPLPPLASQTWRVVARTDAGGRAVLPLAWGDENRTTNYLFAGTSAGHAVAFSGISAGKPIIAEESSDVPNRLVMRASPPRRVFIRGDGSRSQGWVALLCNSSFRSEGGGGFVAHLIGGMLVDAEARRSIRPVADGGGSR